MALTKIKLRTLQAIKKRSSTNASAQSTSFLLITSAKTMKLIYRALIIETTPRPIPTYVKPSAINWRFQPSGERFELAPRPVQPYVKPRAINWRFQPSAMLPSAH